MFRYMEFFLRKDNHCPLIANQKGNIFFALFGAVAIVGLLGAAIVSTMRGPLATMVKVQSRTQAESEMAIASRLALLEATGLANNGDCDADNFVEPLEYKDAGAADHPTGGGFLPDAVASSRTDPWGTNYGYCAWDAGGTSGDPACDIDASTVNERLDGNLDSDPNTGATYTVIAIISAGPDQVFGTTCTGGTTPLIAKTGDDIVTEFTYASAAASTGGLWNIKSGEPGVAEINKNLEVAGGAAFTAGIDLTGSSAALQLGAASMLFPNETTLATCNGANDGLVRINTTADPDILQLCDDPNGWVSVGGNLWSKGAGDDIYYNTGTTQVGIGKTNPTEALDVTGNIATSGNVALGGNLVATGNVSGVDLAATGNTVIGGTLGVTGATSLSSTLGVTGATTLSSTLGVTGNTTIGGTLGVTGATSLSSTLGVTGATTLSSTLNAQGNISNSLGDLTLDDNLVVTGTSDLQGNISDSLGSLVLDDAVDITGNLDTQGNISNSTGNVAINDGTDVTGAITATANIDAGTTINVNGDQLGPALNCTSAQKLKWTNGTGWSCVVDLQGGSGGAGQTLAEVLTTGDDAGGLNAVNLGKIAIGNATPRAELDVNGGDLLVTGTYTGTSAVPVSGAGTRMFFQPATSAFRAGTVSGAQWDDANIGDYSTAMGSRTTASGSASTAMGRETIASGSYSTAMGFRSKASGTYSTAMGYWTTASGSASTAMGNRTTAAGDYSTAMGFRVNITATGDSSAGFGLTTTYPATAPMISGAQSMGIFMGNHSGVDFSAANTMGLFGGKMVIDPNVPATKLSADGTLTVDVEGDIGAKNYCDELGNNCFTPSSISSGGGGLWEINSNVMRVKSASGSYVNDDFVFGSPQLADDGDTTHDSRIFFDKSNAAFRAGGVDGAQWDDANIGIASMAMGVNTTASGITSTAMGNSVNITATGDGSAGFGLTTTYPATAPMISGAQSMGIFMGNHSGVNFSAANTMGLFGGKMVIDPNVPATQLTARSVLDLGGATDALIVPRGTAAQQPLAPVEGMIRFNSDTNVFEGYVDDGTPAWEPINTGAGGLWTQGTGDDIYYNSGTTPMVGVGLNDPLVGLDVNGTIKIADGGEACDATIAGAMRYNSGNIEYCNGTAWSTIATTGTGAVLNINPPNKLNMDITGPGNPASGTNVVFNVSNTGSATSSSLTYTLSNTTNFNVTADTCSGTTLAPAATCQIEITPQATGDGTINGTLTIDQHNQPQSTLQGVASSFGCFAGQAAFGGIVAKCDAYGAGKHLIVTPGNCDGTTNEPTCDGGTDTFQRIWSANTSTSIPQASSTTDGPQNTVNLIDLATGSPNLGITFPAAEYCDSLVYQGKNDWYLPAMFEIVNDITPNQAAIGGFVNTNYRASDTVNKSWASVANPVNGSSSNNPNRGLSYLIRCARREGVALPAPTIDNTPDATVVFATKFATASGQVITSDTVTVTGITPNVVISVTGASAQYSINGGAFTSVAGTVDWGDTVRLRATSGATNTRTQANLTIGTLSTSYSVITEGDCGGSCAGVDKRVFVTSTTYNGNLGGVTGADTKCQTQADAAALGGTWKAIISGINTSSYASNHIDYNWDRLVNMNGDVLATSPSDLWDGSLSNLINYDENGTLKNVGVYSNTLSNGLAKSTISDNNNCAVWSSGSFFAGAPHLGISSSPASWINNGSTGQQCNYTTRSIYCMEQASGTFSIAATPSSQANMDVTGPGSPANGNLVTFTITNDGTSTTAALSTSISNSTNFAITTDNCAGQAIAPAANCTIDVTPQAYADGNFFGTLTVEDTTNSLSLGIGMNGTASSFGNPAGGLWTQGTGDDIYYNAGTAPMVGIGLNDPLVGLDVNGTLKIADGGEACDATIAGAMRYNSGNIEYCNGTIWSLFASSNTGVQLSFTPIMHSNMDVDGSCGTATCEGAVQSFILSNQGAVTSGVIAYGITGDSANFTVVTDTCTGVTLAQNATCQIDVKPVATADGTYTAQIQISNDNQPSAIMTGTTAGFACAPGVRGAGGIYVTCGAVPLVVMPPACDGSTSEPTCNFSGTDGNAVKLPWATGAAINIDRATIPSNEGTNGPQWTVNLMEYVAAEGVGAHPAAEYCANMVLDGYSDWYFPATNEMVTLYTAFNAGTLTGFSAYYYWVSSEWTNNRTYIVNMGNGAVGSNNYKNDSNYVRCVRRDGEALPAPQQDSTPDAFNFTDIAGASTSTRTDSNIVTIKGITGAVPVSITGTDGTPKFKINGGAEVSSGTVNYGDTLTLVMTSAAAADTTYSMTVTVGTVNKTWKVGTGCIPGGSGAGGIYVSCGAYNLVASGVSEITTMSWGGSGILRGAEAQSNANGPQNTVNLYTWSQNEGGGVHPAAEYCMNLSYGGYTDWYLPAADELDLLDGSAFIHVWGGDQYYWSSTEANNMQAVTLKAGHNLSYLTSRINNPKTTTSYVACVRRDGQAMPSPTISGPGPGIGGDNEIVYNLGGALKSKTTYVFDETTDSMGIGTATPAASLDIATTDSILIPRGTTAQQPSSPVNGMIRYNSTTNKFEGYENSAWADVISGSGVSAINDLSDAIYDGSSLFIGNGTGASDDGTNNQNVAMGFSALAANTSGSNNVAIGYQSMITNITGRNNTAIGHLSLYSNNSGQYNTATGQGALYSNVIGSYNTATGLNALYSNTSNYNTAFGNSALASNSSGSGNTAVGSDALTSNTTALQNTAVGQVSLKLNTTGSQNTAVGQESLSNNITGSLNTAVGRSSLSNNKAKSRNTAIGYYSMVYFDDNATTANTNNTALGFYSLKGSGVVANNTGVQNTALGSNTLSENTSGSNNVAIGYQAGDINTTGSDNILIGYNVDAPLATTSNYLNIGGVIKGDINAGDIVINGTAALTLPSGTTAQQPMVSVNGMIRYNTTIAGFEVYEAGAWVGMGAAVSDKRLKSDIKPLDSSAVLERLAQIDTYSYRLNADKTGRTRYGVIAQELEKIFPELVNSPANPDEMKSVRYQELIAPLIAATQELKFENDNLTAKLMALKAERDDMHAMLDDLKHDVNGLKAYTGYGIEKASMMILALGMMFILLSGGALVVIRRLRG